MEPDLNDVLVFVEVAREGGFSAAARNLDLPASVVSRRVARLEERLGFKLLNRTTRQVGLTTAGRIYYDQTASIGRQLQEAARAVEETSRSVTGLVRLTAPPDDGGIIWRLLRGFIAKHPTVDLQIIHTLDYVDLIAERIDVALRGGPAPDTTEFAAHQLFESRILLAASPEYLKERGTPKQVEDLEHHDCLCMDPWAPNAIRRVDGDRSPVRVKVRNRIRANRLTTAQQAALDGFGIAPLLKMTCQAELDDGSLVEVLCGALPPAAPFWAIHPIGRRSSKAAQALIEHLIETAPSLQTGG